MNHLERLHNLLEMTKELERLQSDVDDEVAKCEVMEFFRPYSTLQGGYFDAPTGNAYLIRKEVERLIKARG